MERNYTIEDIRKHLESVKDESRGLTLKETGGIKHIGIDKDKDLVILIISLYSLDEKNTTKVRREISKRIKLDLGFTGVKISLEESRKLNSIVNRNVKFISVISGKGGVGKSTVSVNIAYALKRLGKKVALIDCDIYGSSIPTMLSIPLEYPESNEEGKIVPFKSHGMEVISTEFFAEPGQPVIWRGSMLNSMVTNFFYEVNWDKFTDYVVIDCPPGTGDVLLDIKNIVPNCMSILVTTPSMAASHVAVKSGVAINKLKQNLVGVVENMSYYLNPATKKPDYIFGSGGGEDVSSKLGVELLAKIPINQPTHHHSLYESDEEIGEIYDNLALLLSILE